MIIIATTTKMMIKILIAIASSGGFETIPQASLDPAFPHPSPSGVRSSSPFSLKRWQLLRGFHSWVQSMIVKKRYIIL